MSALAEIEHHEHHEQGTPKPQAKPNDDQAAIEATRWANYAIANNIGDRVRTAELDAMMKLLEIRTGDTVVEFGCGSGALTKRLSAAVGEEGRIIALDVNKKLSDTIDTTSLGNVDVRRIIHGNKLPVENGIADKLTSIATLHHFPKHLQQGLFRECKRVAKPGASIVVGDVGKGTKTANYFDRVVATICSTGHDLPFLDGPDMQRLYHRAGFTIDVTRTQEVPWVFASPTEAGWFLQKIHDATNCSARACLESAEKYLGFELTPEELVLGWDLLFTRAVVRKKVSLQLQQGGVHPGPSNTN